MDFKTYQEKAKTTAVYPATLRVIYPTLGLNGEAGEVAEKVKKIYRDKDGIITVADLETIKKEIGDVLWYLSVLCSDLGLSLDEVADDNIAKLESRKKRGVLHGNGDNR